MTREQGYRLFHLIFESEDQRAGYVYYGPSQKMIHVLPLNGQSVRFQENDFINLREIAEYGFLDIGSLEHWITKETVKRSNDFSDSLTNEYLELIDYMETPAGQHVVYHTIAHNNFIKGILEKRIELWKSFLDIYYDQSIPLEDVIQKLTIKWPRASQRIANSVIEEYSEYELMYEKEYREIKKNFSDDNLSWCDKMMQLAFIIEEAFAVEHNYEEIRSSAIKALADQNSFDNHTPWQSSNEVFEEFLSLQENLEQMIKTQLEIHQQLTQALAGGNDSDPRHIIQRPMQDDSDSGCNRFVTINEFCEIARISRNTYYRLRDKGEIPFTKIGGQVRIPSQVLDDYAKKAGEGSQKNSSNIQDGID